MDRNGLTVSVKEARKIILSSITPLEPEEISILDAQNRILYSDIKSEIMIPPLDNSAMDGYAVMAEDTKGASEKNPRILKLCGEIQAGNFSKSKISKGTCMRIMTGAPLPEGADAVVPFEDSEDDNSATKIFTEINKNDNIRFAGEDIRKGDIALKKGDILNPADIGLIASLNNSRVKVYKRPEVAIISTGNEIVDINAEIIPGQIRNSNSYTLYSEVKKYNAIPHIIGIARDNIEETINILKKSLEYDIVISTGGVSMGKYDFVKEAYLNLDVDIKFEWVRVKPGRPCMFGQKGNKLLFGLPGNPVSTLTSFIQFVRPAILKLMGANKINKPVVEAILEEDIKKKPDRLHLIRGIFTIRNNNFYVATTGPQGSGILRSMSNANCLIIIPQNITKVTAGEKVNIQLINHDEIP
ncbi:MAG: molybdopterin molybdotransferase MoeA [Spirochaetes bacterium]|nr:molybdopterin molybdotransferase MoeA [Spirochaetota bacterium]